MGDTRFNRGLVREAAVGFGARFFGVLASVILTWVIPQLTDVQSLGVYMIGYSITLGIGTIARLGSSVRLVRWGVRARNAGDVEGLFYIFASAATMSTVLSVVLGIVLLFIWTGPFQFVAAPSNFDDLLPFLIAAPASSVLFIYSAYCKVVEKPNLSPIFETVTPVFITICGGAGAILLGLGNGASAFSWSFCIATYLVAAIGIIVPLCRGKIPVASLLGGLGHLPTRKDEWTGGTVDYALIDFLNYSFQYGIIVLAGFLIGEAGTGVLSVLMRITLTLNFIVLVFNSVTIARFASLHGSGDISRLFALANRTSAYMIFCALPVVGIIVLFPQSILAFFGEGLSASWPAMLVLLAGQVINVATGSVGPILNMTGYQRQLRNTTIFSILITIALIVILSGPLGIMGVAIGVAAGVVTKNLLASVVVRIKLGKFVIPNPQA